MKVALVHDWLVGYRGGERVLEAMSELYPEAPIYTLFYDAARMPASFRSKDIRYPQALAWLRPVRKLLLPWLPALVESLPLDGYDLILSSSSCVAKGALGGPATKHLCYIHSPMRYVWDQRAEYLQGLRKIPGASLAINLAAPALRVWDSVSAQRVDAFVANSRFVQARVAKYYQRPSQVIHPPIAVDEFRPAAGGSSKPGYFLVAGAFVAYKRFDLAIAACERLGKKLIVAGSGPYEKQLRRSAQAATTEFRIAPDQAAWRRLLQDADALIFPGVEDFGMIAVEAMASGTPVLAYQKGGALDFIEPGVSGEFFADSSLSGLCAALASFEPRRYDPEALWQHAQRYNKEHFQAALRREVAALLGA